MEITVKITFKRIQNFLFAVPRLRAMLGANVLLGETIRVYLARKVDEAINACGTAPPDINATVEQHTIGTPPATDPLDDTLRPGDGNRDDPNALYKRGILSRDGGHFHAVFASEDTANHFIDSARKLIEENLPGLNYEIEAPRLDKQNTTLTFGANSTRLPHFEICQDTGIDVANGRGKADPGEEKPYISATVMALEEAGDAFMGKQPTQDIIGLLENQLPLTKDYSTANDLKKLAGDSGYLALIHADGNSVGYRLNRYQQEKINEVQSEHELEACIESFFWAMRRAFRRAVVEALCKTFKELKDHQGPRPYQLLMLGGDDLLILCRPEHAFRLVTDLATEIARYDLPDGKPLSLGIGISIAKHTIPFYLMNDLAEELAGSAKKLYRSQSDERSVVDWNMATTSWVDAVLEVRRKQSERDIEGTRYLRTARPYYVLDNSEMLVPSLKNLLENADKILQKFDAGSANEGASRAKLKTLAKLHYDDPSAVDAYYRRFYSGENAGANKSIHTRLDSYLHGGSPWKPVDDNYKLTHLIDLAELVEVHYLGQQDQTTHSVAGTREAPASAGGRS